MRSRTFLLLSALLLAVTPVFAEVAFVYENRDAVLKSQSTFGTVVSGTVVVDSKPALLSSSDVLVGVAGGDLCTASLLRFDNELKAALFKIGPRVDDARLQEAHRARSSSLLTFIPNAAAAETPAVSTAPKSAFIIKINGKDVAEGPISIKFRGGFPRCNVDVINVSTLTVWNAGLEIESKPALAFWKRGMAMRPGDRPMEVFKYNYQFMITPMKDEKKLSVSLDVYRIEVGSHEWTFRVKSKEDVLETITAKVNFEK